MEKSKLKLGFMYLHCAWVPIIFSNLMDNNRNKVLVKYVYMISTILKLTMFIF